MMGTFRYIVERDLRLIKMRASWDRLVGVKVEKLSLVTLLRAATCRKK